MKRAQNATVRAARRRLAQYETRRSVRIVHTWEVPTTRSAARSVTRVAVVGAV